MNRNDHKMVPSSEEDVDGMNGVLGNNADDDDDDTNNMIMSFRTSRNYSSLDVVGGGGYGVGGNNNNMIVDLGDVLLKADDALDRIEKDGMLGTAIVRGCNDIADAISNLAHRIEQQTDNDRRILAQAYIQDATTIAGQQRRRQQQELYLVNEAAEEEEDSSDELLGHRRQEEEQYFDMSDRMSRMTEVDMMDAIRASCTLLRDVEHTLRTIDIHDANEIADVALVVAKIFVASLQSIHANIISSSSSNGATGNAAEARGLAFSSLDPLSSRIEILEDRFEEVAPLAADVLQNEVRKKIVGKSNRVRILWPPLGPAVDSALHWGKDAAVQHPILSAAIGITCWPAIVITAMLGTPAVVLDGYVQGLYNDVSKGNGAVITRLEEGAGWLYQTARLYLLCAKLISRQSIRIIQRQVDRCGGPGPMAIHVMGFMLDRVTHPIDTVVSTWNGVSTAVHTVHNMFDKHSHHMSNILDVVVPHRYDETERSKFIQELQQL